MNVFLANESLRILVLSAVLLGLLGCSGSGPRHENAPVILITIDTLRSDRLQPYGNNQFDTPAFQALANDGILFEHAFAHVPLTLPSHASLMTGKLPPSTGVRDNIGFYLDPAQQTLAESLRDKGYETAAVVSSMVLRRSTGIEQGFQSYYDSFRSADASAVGAFAQRDGASSLALAKSWLEARGKKPFFLWVHLFEPHTPYQPPAGFQDPGMSAYDGEVRFTDHLLGNFFAFLKQKGLYDSSLIVLTSDHGEGLGEHGEEEHGMLLYREAIQVPLIFKLPGNALQGTRRIENVGLIDVAPTVARIIGKDLHGDGVDLFSKKGADDERVIYSESLNAELFFGWHPGKSAVQQEWHYIRNDEDRLFDWHADSKELNNLFGDRPVPALAIEQLEEIGEGEKDEVAVSDEDKAMLASLGYSGGFDFGDEIKALSEKQFMELFYKVGEVKGLVAQGSYRQAQPLLEEILARFPDIVDVRLMLGTVLTGLGRFEEAERHYLESMARSPKNISLMVGLITAKLGQKQDASAANLARKVVSMEPVMGAKLLIPTLTRFNLFPLASNMARDLMVKIPDYSYGEFVFGREAYATGQYDNAIQHFRAMKERGMTFLEPMEKAEVCYYLGDSLGRKERLPEALKELNEAIAHRSNHVRAQMSKALVLFSMGQSKQALVSLEEWMERYPTRESYARSAETLDLVGLKKQADSLRLAMAKLPQ